MGCRRRCTVSIVLGIMTVPARNGSLHASGKGPSPVMRRLRIARHLTAAVILIWTNKVRREQIRLVGIGKSVGPCVPPSRGSYICSLATSSRPGTESRSTRKLTNESKS